MKRRIEPNFPDFPAPPVPPSPCCCPFGLPLAPPEPPELPEPYYGQRRIVARRETPDERFDMVRFADGRPWVVPHGYVFDGYGMRHNGPRTMDTHDIRGDISNSEGMDAPNLWFNNSDCGQNF